MHPYLERILATLGDRDPVATLEATPIRLASWLELAPLAARDEPWRPGGWTAREILAHLADVEMATGFRLRQAVADPGRDVTPFDQDAWARRYARLDPSLAVEAFRGLRAWNLALLSGFDLDDWLAEPRHPEFGPMPVDVMVRWLAGHDLNHLAQLEAISEA